MSEFDKKYGSHWVLLSFDYDAQDFVVIGMYHSLSNARSDAELFVRENGGKCYIAKFIDAFFEEDL